MKFNLTVFNQKNNIGTMEYHLVNQQLHNDWELKFEDRDTMIDILVRIILKDKQDVT